MDETLIRFSGAVTPDAGVPGRFRAVAYSGDVIPNYHYAFGDVAIDLGTLEFANPIPVLADHANALDAIVGSAELSIDGNQLIATGQLTTATETGRMVEALLKGGHPVQLSVGINADVREIKRADLPVQMNGRDLMVGAVYENATVREVSFVAVGADPRTSAQLFNKQEHDMDQKEIDTLRAQLAEAQARNTELEAALTELRAQFSAKVKAERELALAEFDVADEQKAAMLEMTDAQFAASIGLAKSVKKAAPEHLFRDTATGGKPPADPADKPLTQAVKARYNA